MEEPPEAASQVGIPPPGFRLPAESRLGPVSLQVADLDRSVEYYTRVLGLRESMRTRAGVNLGAAGGRELVRLRAHPGTAPVPRRGRLGLYHFALLLPDRASLGAFLAHLRELGVQPGMSDHSVSEAIYLTDPDGLGIEIYADRPREAWQTRGRELYMTTEPLDVEGVLRSANRRWEGMPEGTIVGHVHLFVGSLDAADTFYHRGLGLDRIVWSYPGALFLSAGGYHHHLGTNTWASDAGPAGPEDARLLEWRVELPEGSALREAAESMARIDVAVEWEEGGWRAADPWGTVLAVRAMDSSAPEAE